MPCTVPVPGGAWSPSRPGYTENKAVRVFWVHIPVAAAAIAWNLLAGGLAPWGWLACLSAGLLLWTLLEYLIHRFAFHGFAPHWQHHERPRDRQWIFAPLWLSTGAALLLWGLLAAALRSLPHAALVTAGIVAGYLAYEAVHLTIHGPRAGCALLVALRRRHYYHHFADDTACYGVTSPLWDRIFGSLPKNLTARRDFPYHEADTGGPGRLPSDPCAAGEGRMLAED